MVRNTSKWELHSNKNYQNMEYKNTENRKCYRRYYHIIAMSSSSKVHKFIKNVQYIDLCTYSPKRFIQLKELTLNIIYRKCYQRQHIA